MLGEIQSLVLEPARQAVYQHQATYTHPQSGARLTLVYVGPVEDVTSRVIETYECVDRSASMERVSVRLELVGTINDEGDEEVLSFKSVSLR